MVDQVNEIENVQKIEEIETLQPKPIPFDLFSKKTNKTTRLVNNVDAENEMKGRSEWYHFPLEHPIFVSRIEIFAEHYEFKNAEVSWQSVRLSSSTERRVKFDKDLFICEINDLVSGFSFRPDSKYWGNPTIQRVVAHGYTLAEVDSAIQQIGKIQSVKAEAVRSATETINKSSEARLELAERKVEIDTVKEKISELDEALTHATKRLESLRSEGDRVAQKTARLQAEQSAGEARLEQQASTIEERTIERKQLISEISTKKSELKELVSSLYMFPSELKEFARKGSEDKAFYWRLSIIPLLVLTVLAFALLKNAADLTTIFDENENARLVSIFVTRIPFVVVSGALIGVMFKLAHALIRQIMSIDAQTRALAKLSIVATDVSAASAEKLDLDDEEIYHLRTGLKMDLLREHLKTYISDDYSYLGSDRVSTRMENLQERFKAKQQAEKEAMAEMNEDLNTAADDEDAEK